MHIKKLIALLLSLLMVFALCATAFAAESTGTITVSNANLGETYKAYKIFDLTYASGDKFSYSIKTTSAWYADVSAATDLFTLTKTTDSATYTVAVNSGVDAEDIVNWAKAHISGKTADASATKETGATVTMDCTYGYYYVTSTTGTAVSVDSATPNVTIQDKNGENDVAKYVKNAAQTEYSDLHAAAQIGDTVNFKVVIYLVANAENVVYTDTMSDSLTLDTTSIVVKDDSDAVIAASNYTVSYPGAEDDWTFKITFTQAYLDSLTGDTELGVYYDAVLNEQADVLIGSLDQNVRRAINTAKLTWGAKQSAEDNVFVTCDEFYVLKYAEGDTTKAALAGATFQLLDKDKNIVKLVKVSDTVYRVANGNETGAVESFTTVDAGQIRIYGINGNNTYYLNETQAPDGYNKLEDPVSFKMDCSCEFSGDIWAGTIDASYADEIVEISNATGTELPSTGGIGTTVFYIVGGMLMLGAAVVLVARKKNSAEQ